jgi:hypothetical protein
MKVHSKNGKKSYEYNYKMIPIYSDTKEQLKEHCKKKDMTYTEVIKEWLNKKNGDKD